MILIALERCELAHDILVLFLSDSAPPFASSQKTKNIYIYGAGVLLPYLWFVSGDLRGITNYNRISYVDVLTTYLDRAAQSSRPSGPGFAHPRLGCSVHRHNEWHWPT